MLAFLVTATSTQRCKGGVLDDLEGSVLLLRDKVPVKEVVNGTEFEVWLRDPRVNAVLQKTFDVSGSGFLVASERVGYLVTAKHVATNMGRSCGVSLRGAEGKTVTLTLSALIGVRNQQLGWIHHPDLDLSVHPILPDTPEAIEAVRGKALPIQALKTNRLAPNRDLVLTTLGFPWGLGAELRFSPIAKESKPASGFIQEGIYGFFLMQDPSVSGFSGAPVFEPGDPRVVATSTNGVGVAYGGTGCWGLVSATLADISGGKMARIIPSQYLVDVIRDFEKNVAFRAADAPPAELRGDGSGPQLATTPSP